MSDWHSEIAEWWDHHGDYHEGSPTEEQMLDEAVQMTGHMWDDAGNDMYFTSFSDDGWEPDEWADDVDDAIEYYQ